ncbi:hypothetical protein LCGC14_1745240 [marine sediment metagenome]|uniref:Uncharacterized protein n=1 Tax=marine sediment metagenome TaxID=412755 RepID=A0A0F9H5J9_9ZZZZ|nr:hypothetical protein [Candidatus Scalindua sp.]
MKKIEAVKIIRKELFKGYGANGADFTNWGIVEDLSKRFGLQDTAYVDKIFHHNKEGLLEDFLLDLRYYKKRFNPQPK